MAQKSATDQVTNQSNIDCEIRKNEQIQLPECSGWLFKRRKITNKWEKVWFVLDKGQFLNYSKDAAAKKVKSINLIGAQFDEDENDKLTFTIVPSDAKRKFVLRAENDEELQKWMDVICTVKANEKTDNSQACSIQ